MLIQPFKKIKKQKTKQKQKTQGKYGQKKKSVMQP